METPQKTISKCPVGNARKLTFALAAKILGLINVRTDLEKRWENYDIDKLYREFIDTGIKPFINNPEERYTFLRYAHSKISIYTTEKFLDIPIKKDNPLIDTYVHEGDFESLKTSIQNAVEQTIQEAFRQYKDILSPILNEPDATSDISKLMRLIDNVPSPKGGISFSDSELLRFMTTNGILPVICDTGENFGPILEKQSLNITSYTKALKGDSSIPWKAMSNIPSIYMYFFEKHKGKFLWSEKKRTRKMLAQFMNNGFPIMRFDPETETEEMIYTTEYFKNITPIISANHPKLEIEKSYVGCPLFYEKHNGINMIRALYVKLAEMIFEHLIRDENPPLS